MKQLLEFFPLIVFFIVYKLYDIYIASGALIASTALMLIVYFSIYRRLEKSHIITFIAVAVFGGLTVALHNDAFIKWKVTVIYALFSGALLVSQYVLKKPLIKKMLGKELSLPDKIYNRVNLAWALFFLVCSISNIYVAFWLSQETWVDFKVFGLFGATLAFTVVTIIYIYRYLPKETAKEDEDA